MKTVCLCVSGYLINHGLFAVCVDSSRVISLRGKSAGVLGKAVVISLNSPVSFDPFPENK